MEPYQIDDFEIMPLNLPADGPDILHLHYQSYLNETALQTYPPEGPITEPEYKKIHLPYLLEQFDQPANISAKLVPRPTAANPNPPLIGYVMLKPPKEADSRSEAERRQALREEVEGMGGESAEDNEATFGMMWQGKMLSEKLLGKGYEARYWLLDALFVDVEYQRKGLGTRLTKWGVDAVKEHVDRTRPRRMKKACCCKKEPEQMGKELEKVEGVYLISSPVAQKTYLNCGFEKIGELPASKGTGKEQEFIFSWYVKKF